MSPLAGQLQDRVQDYAGKHPDADENEIVSHLLSVYPEEFMRLKPSFFFRNKRNRDEEKRPRPVVSGYRRGSGRIDRSVFENVLTARKEIAQAISFFIFT